MRALYLICCSALLLAVTRLHAQGVSAPCSHPDISVEGAQDFCFTVAQALESAQPQVGILVAGGNPTIGTASAGGLRLGMIPRVNAALNLNVVLIELPDILAESGGSAGQTLHSTIETPAPALSGTISVGVFPGLNFAPTVGGVVSVDLLASASWLPLSAFEVEGFGGETSNLAYGGGVKIGLLRESFMTPGVSLSVMYRGLGEVRYGDVCPGASAGTSVLEDESFQLESEICAGGGDSGELTADLTDWSGRAMIGKRLAGLGLTAGVGYDRFSSDVGFGFRAPENTVAGAANRYWRASDLSLDNDRWSAFVDGSLTVLVATIAAEAGWLQGEDEIEGFPSGSDFDPAKGTFFGSLGVRIAL